MRGWGLKPERNEKISRKLWRRMIEIMTKQIANLKRNLEIGGCDPEGVYIISGDAIDCVPYLNFRFRDGTDQGSGKEPVYIKGRLDTGARDGVLLPRDLFDELEAKKAVTRVSHHEYARYGDGPVPCGTADLLVPARNSRGDTIEVPVNMVIVRGVDAKYIRGEPAIGMGFIQGFMGRPFSIGWEENSFEIAVIPSKQKNIEDY